jgi:hypothetical protein
MELLNDVVDLGGQVASIYCHCNDYPSIVAKAGIDSKEWYPIPRHTAERSCDKANVGIKTREPLRVLSTRVATNLNESRRMQKLLVERHRRMKTGVVYEGE